MTLLEWFIILDVVHINYSSLKRWVTNTDGHSPVKYFIAMHVLYCHDYLYEPLEENNKGCFAGQKLSMSIV